MDFPLDIEAIFEKMRWKMQPWQMEYLQSKAKRRVLLIGRKGGKSVAECADNAIKLVTPGYEGRAFDGGLLTLSQGQTQAKELLSLTKIMLECDGWRFSQERKDISLDDMTGYASASQLLVPIEDQDFPNRLVALPAGRRADNIRPWSFHDIKYDEADFLPNDVYISTAACAAVHNATITYASNPNRGSRAIQSEFYKAVHNPEFKVWRLMTKQCSTVSSEFLYNESKRMSKEDYAREYEISWGGTHNGFYDMQNTVLPCVAKQPFNKFELLKSCQVYLGVDFGRFGEDDSVIAYAAWKDNRAHVWADVIHGKFRLTYVTGRIAALFAKYPRIQKVITDETGIGAGATDELIQRLGLWRVIGIENHKRVSPVDGGQTRFQKIDLHSNFIRLMENGQVSLENDRKMLRSIAGVEHRYLQSGDISLGGREDHIVEAVVRAVFPFMRWRPPSATAIEVMGDANL